MQRSDDLPSLALSIKICSNRQSIRVELGHAVERAVDLQDASNIRIDKIDTGVCASSQSGVQIIDCGIDQSWDRLTARTQRIAVDAVLCIIERNLFGQLDDGAFGRAVCGCEIWFDVSVVLFLSLTQPLSLVRLCGANPEI